jgi:16S rRNA C967 or C1407 C5-methylase (RsmB/RsmF family)/NOL1/NOP2/fmu family ribosome biogenesis protein
MPRSLPQALLGSLQGLPGFDREAFIAVHEQAQPPVSIRINPLKQISEYAFPLVSSDRVPWSAQGFYLPERPSFTLDPLFHAGTYYVQEASSMFLEQAVQASGLAHESIVALDLCAAPGGKSTLMQSLLTPTSLLVSNEVIQSRVPMLMENMQKWGGSNSIITANDPANFGRLPGFFDMMVVDAPCSGSGLFRKDPRAMDEWSTSNVMHCSQRQQRILTDVLPALKQNGVLIYSTCSYAVEENETIVEWLMAEHGLEPIDIPLEEDWQIVRTQNQQGALTGYRFFPNRLRGEGFFICALRNTRWHAAGEKGNQRTQRNTQAIQVATAPSNPWVTMTSEQATFQFQDQWYLFPKEQFESLFELQRHLRVRKAGTCLGTWVRDGWIPDHAVAMSTQVNRQVDTIALDHEQALQFLRHQPLTGIAGSMGWQLVSFRQQPLGFVKVLSNRINNYYPKAWRIVNK